MTHLSRTESGKYIIAKIQNNNGRKLHTTETLNRKRTAIDNMIAVLKDDEQMFMKFQDNTGAQPVINILSIDGTITATEIKPFKPYVPKGKAARAIKLK